MSTISKELLSQLVSAWRNRARQRFEVVWREPEHAEVASRVATIYANCAGELEQLLDGGACGGGEGAKYGVEGEVDGAVCQAGEKGAPAGGVSGGIKEVVAFPGEAKGDDNAGVVGGIGLNEAKEKIRLYRESCRKSIGFGVEGDGFVGSGSLDFEQKGADVVEVAFHFRDGEPPMVVAQVRSGIRK